MSKATNNGILARIEDCYLDIPFNGGSTKVRINNLPDISDTKSANYNPENIIGRSSPLYNYSNSGDRTISMQIHFFVLKEDDIDTNLFYLSLIQSAVYPRKGTIGVPFKPPPVCKLKCGNLLSNKPLCVILQSYSVKFPTEVAWGANKFTPYRFDVDTSWFVVDTSADLPFQDRIILSRS